MEERLAPALDWVVQGPGPILHGQTEGLTASQNAVIGAGRVVLAHPTNANVMYVGSVNGGIWKTSNATAASPTWTPLTDQLGSLSIGAMVFDPTDATHNTLVAGFGRYSSLGPMEGGPLLGLIRSTNGGASWSLIDGAGKLSGKSISGIVARGNTLLVSVDDPINSWFGLPINTANTGIFRSTDGGATFTQMSVSTGATTGLPAGYSFGIAGDPSNPARIFTGIVGASGGGANGLYRSDNYGATWTKVSNAVMDLLINNAGANNIKIAVGTNNNVYVAIAVNGQLAGLFRNGNGGNPGWWIQLDTPVTNEGGTNYGLQPRSKAGAQGTIHFSMVADPVNHNIVYLGGDRQPGQGDPGASFPNSLGAKDYSGRLFRVDASQPSGSQVAAITHSMASPNSTGTPNSSLQGTAPHADSRDLTFDALGNLIQVDDGGIYKRTLPRAATGVWSSIIGNLGITESHSIAYDSINDTIIAGNQDTGSIFQQSTLGTTWDSFPSLYGLQGYQTGDGGVVAVDDLSSPTQSVRYVSFYGLGGLQRSTWNASNVIQGTPTAVALTVMGTGGTQLGWSFGDFTLPFYPKIVLNALDPRLMVIGSQSLYESFDQGDNLVCLGGVVNSGGVWGPVVTLSNTVTAMAYGGISGGTLNYNVLYAGLANGEVRVRTLGNGLPTPTTQPLSARNLNSPYIRDIVLDPSDYRHAIVVDDDQVFETTNAGASWTDITGANLRGYFNFAKGGTLRAGAFVPLTGSAYAIVVAGTGGAWATKSTSPGVWFPVGDSTMPNVLVNDLEYDRADDVLVAGTIGRGSWKLSDAAVELAANIAPTLILPGSAVTYNENTPPVLLDNTAVVIDPDSLNFNQGGLTAKIVSNRATGDRLTINNQGTGSGQIGVSGSNITYGGAANIIGTFTGGTGANELKIIFNANANVAAVQALVRNLQFDNTTVPPSTLPRTISLVLSDGVSVGSTVYKVVNVASPNDAPVLDTSADYQLPTIAPGAVNNPGVLVTTLVGNRIADPDGPGSLEGIAITSVTTTDGAWQYSTNNGTTWQTLQGVTTSAARLLAADANTRVRFVPNANFTGTVNPGFRFVAWDRTTGTAGSLGDATTTGGYTAFSSGLGTAVIDVRIDLPPTISAIANQLINVNTSTGALPFTIGDPDTALGSLVVTARSSNLTLVPNNRIFLGGSGASRTVQVTPTAYRYGSATITVTVSDGTTAVTESFVVSVNANVGLPFSDTFNRANNANLGARWTTRGGSIALFNNQAYVNSPQGIATANGVLGADVSLQATVYLSRPSTQGIGLVARYQGPGDNNLYYGGLVGFTGGFWARIFRNLNGQWQMLSSTFVNNGVGVLRFNVIGSSLKLYFNNVLVGNVIDSTIPTVGMIGIRGSLGARLDNFSAAAAFASVTSSPLVAPPTTTTATPTTNGPLYNVGVQASVSLLGTGQEQASLIARSGANGLYQATLIGGNGSYQAQIWRKYNNVWTLLASARVSSRNGLLRFEARGTSLRLYFGGNLVAAASDSLLGAGLTSYRASQNAILTGYRVDALA